MNYLHPEAEFGTESEFYDLNLIKWVIDERNI